MPFVASTDPLRRGEPVYVEQELRARTSYAALKELKADLAKLAAPQINPYNHSLLPKVSNTILLEEIVILASELKRRVI